MITPGNCIKMVCYYAKETVRILEIPLCPKVSWVLTNSNTVRPHTPQNAFTVRQCLFSKLQGTICLLTRMPGVLISLIVGWLLLSPPTTFILFSTTILKESNLFIYHSQSRSRTVPAVAASPRSIVCENRISSILKILSTQELADTFVSLFFCFSPVIAYARGVSCY